MMSFPQRKAVQKGWTYGLNSFYQHQKMVMPEYNVALKAIFFYFQTLTYDSGKVNGIIGVTSIIQTGYFGEKMDFGREFKISPKGL